MNKQNKTLSFLHRNPIKIYRLIFKLECNFQRIINVKLNVYLKIGKKFISDYKN